jgi:chromosome segregation ATPase
MARKKLKGRRQEPGVRDDRDPAPQHFNEVVEMFKKLAIVAVIGFIAVAAVKSTKIGSYIKTEFNSLRESVEDSIPPEKEIARLRGEIKELDKDLNTVMDQVARERVEVKQLKEKAEDLRAQQSKDYEILQARSNALKNAKEHAFFGDRKLSIADATNEFKALARQYEIRSKSLDSMDDTLKHREKIKDTLEKQLETLKNQRVEMLAAVDGLEAELNALKLQQMESKYQTDDSRLAKIKEDIRTLRTKFEIDREKLKLQPAVRETSSSSVSNRSPEEIMNSLTPPSKSTESTGKIE